MSGPGPRRPRQAQRVAGLKAAGVFHKREARSSAATWEGRGSEDVRDAACAQSADEQLPGAWRTSPLPLPTRDAEAKMVEQSLTDPMSVSPNPRADP